MKMFKIILTETTINYYNQHNIMKNWKEKDLFEWLSKNCKRRLREKFDEDAQDYFNGDYDKLL